MRNLKCTLFLTAAMLFALQIPTTQGIASAIPDTKEEIIEMTPRYELAGSIDTSFSINNNTAKLLLIVNAPLTKKVSITMILQRKDGDSWTKVQTWKKAGTGNQTLSKSMLVTKGRKYRMKYTVTVGSETITGKTAAKTA